MRAASSGTIPCLRLILTAELADEDLLSWKLFDRESSCEDDLLVIWGLFCPNDTGGEGGGEVVSLATFEVTLSRNVRARGLRAVFNHVQ